MKNENVLIQKELSFQIVGACFDVFRRAGGGHKENFYQRALAMELKERKLKFQEQVEVNLFYLGQRFGKYRMDFIVEEKIVVEIKALERFRLEHYNQVKGYLSQTQLDLGILVRFSDTGATFQRILRPYEPVIS